MFLGLWKSESMKCEQPFIGRFINSPNGMEVHGNDRFLHQGERVVPFNGVRSTEALPLGGPIVDIAVFGCPNRQVNLPAGWEVVRRASGEHFFFESGVGRLHDVGTSEQVTACLAVQRGNDVPGKPPIRDVKVVMDGMSETPPAGYEVARVQESGNIVEQVDDMKVIICFRRDSSGSGAVSASPGASSTGTAAGGDLVGDVLVDLCLTVPDASETNKTGFKKIGVTDALCLEADLNGPGSLAPKVF
jgi:hypothetical protein